MNKVAIFAERRAAQSANNVVRTTASTLETGGGGGESGGMEARVAVLEQIAKSTEAVLKELRDDAKELRRNQERDFRLTWAGMIAIALGLAGLMAKGFKWF